MDFEKLLDDVGRHILRELQENPRIAYSELGRRVGMTQPAAAERIRRMEEAGIITGYRVELDLEKVGLPISAMIRVDTPDEGKGSHLLAEVRAMPEVLECLRVTGDESYVLRVAVASLKHLERLISRLTPYGQPSTSVILSSTVRRVMEINPPSQPAASGHREDAQAGR